MHNNLNKYVRLEYRPEIDGLRALAILSVILFHFGRKLLSGGFLGVDVFFVISGFLITSLLLKDSDDGWSSLKRFWLRRVKRITPALITMVGITLVVTLFLLPKWEHGLKGWHGFSSLLSFANITMWRMDDNYWGPQAAQSLFLHCWSLSIEEQFYILFPFLVMFCKRKGNLLFYLICAIIFVSLALFIYSTQFHYRAAFYLLPMRAWELAVGSLVAIFVAHRVDPQLHKPTVISNALQFGGLIVIVASFILVDANNRTTLYTMWPVFGTALLLWSTTYYKGLVAKFLSNRLFVYLGKISYSLYLWHWPVISMADQVYFDIPLPVIILLVLLLAIGSYHLIESPCRKRNKPFVGIAIGFTVALALTVFMMNRTSSYDVSMFSEDKISYDQYDVSPYLPRRNKLSGTVVPDCTTVNTLRIQQNGLIKNYGKEGQKPDIVVLGDSHALMWASLIDDISRELKISVAFFPVSGVPPFFKIPPVNQVSAHGLLLGSFHVEILNRIEQWKPIVIISMRWSHCMETTTYDLLDLLHTLGCSVVLIEDPPELYFEHSNTMQHLAFRGKYPVDGSVQYLEQRRNRLNLTNKTFNVLLSKYDNCSSVLVKDLFLKEGKVWVLDGRKVLYHDGDHLNNDGILKVKERMKCKIDEVIKKSNNQ